MRSHKRLQSSPTPRFLSCWLLSLKTRWVPTEGPPEQHAEQGTVMLMVEQWLKKINTTTWEGKRREWHLNNNKWWYRKVWQMQGTVRTGSHTSAYENPECLYNPVLHAESMESSLTSSEIQFIKDFIPQCLSHLVAVEDLSMVCLTFDRSNVPRGPETDRCKWRTMTEAFNSA